MAMKTYSQLRQKDIVIKIVTLSVMLLVCTCPDTGS